MGPKPTAPMVLFGWQVGVLPSALRLIMCSGGPAILVSQWKALPTCGFLGSTRPPWTLLCSDSIVLLGLASLRVFFAGSTYVLAQAAMASFEIQAEQVMSHCS